MLVYVRFLQFQKNTLQDVNLYKGHHTITITCEADQTFSGMPEEPRECQAICDTIRKLEIEARFKEYLQNPDDKASYDCTDGDLVGSVCTVVCPPGFEQYRFGKYAPKSSTKCTKKFGSGWNPPEWTLSNCAPIGYYDEN